MSSRMSNQAAIICFTEHGAYVALRAAEALRSDGRKVQLWCKMKTPPREAEKSFACYAGGDGAVEEEASDGHPEFMIRTLDGSLREWTGARFADCSLILFVSATGIAVRMIAPFLKSKTTDPAVLVVDEQGTFVISLVSGHIGGANEIAAQLADALQATPVITTATDLNGKFAVDVFARKNNLAISDMKLAKEVAARLLRGEHLTVATGFPIAGKVPAELRVIRLPFEQITMTDADDQALLLSPQKIDILISIEKDECKQIRQTEGTPYQVTDRTLQLTPRVLSVGMGCRKGKDAEAIRAFFHRQMTAAGLSLDAVCCISSIDLKAQEEGLIALASELGVPFLTYSAEALLDVPGDFSSSAFVKDTTGVNNVCERSAVRACSEGEAAPHVLIKKQAEDGMTFAVAMREGGLSF